MYMSHYLYRSFVYPLRMRGGKRMPAGICALAAIFCAYNGYLQGRLWSALTVVELETPMATLRFASGFSIWALGWGINMHSDALLRRLRAPGESGYKIPRGGLFEWVSGANYLGEVVEWAGYALASWRLAPLAFALFTLANTGPRAYQHHQWYLNKFKEEYPKHRRALIPFVW